MGKIVKYCSSCDEGFAEKFVREIVRPGPGGIRGRANCTALVRPGQSKAPAGRKTAERIESPDVAGRSGKERERSATRPQRSGV